MAFIFRRDLGARSYTPFDLDDEIIGAPDLEWDAFLAGTGLGVPKPWITGATQQKQTSGRLPDNLTIRTSLFCSERFRLFVESFEPGLHFFRPVNLKRKNGERIGDYYVWSVGQDVDCILTSNLERFWDLRDPPRFEFNRAVTAAAYQQNYPDKGDGTRIEVSAPAVAGRHLWLGGLLAHYSRGDLHLFMSDEMHAAYRKEKFTGLQPQCSAVGVDCPWIAAENMGPLLAKWEAREKAIAANWPNPHAQHGGAQNG
jgi:hypothetical protein